MPAVNWARRPLISELVTAVPWNGCHTWLHELSSASLSDSQDRVVAGHHHQHHCQDHNLHNPALSTARRRYHMYLTSDLIHNHLEHSRHTRLVHHRLQTPNVQACTPTLWAFSVVQHMKIQTNEDTNHSTAPSMTHVGLRRGLLTLLQGPQQCPHTHMYTHTAHLLP